MTEEIQIQNEQKNTVATVGMWFSIIWLILTILVVSAWFWIPLLILWFILWIIGLFYKPRWKARIAVCIPLVVFAAFVSLACYVWKSVKTPAYEFVDWLQIEFENVDEESFDKDRFNDITNEEFNNIISSMTEEDFKALMEDSTWSNVLEKWSYVIFGLLQQGFETSFERYNNELLELDEENDETVDEEDVNDEDVNDEDDADEDEESIEERTVVESTETFSQDEKNDIEEILDILE